MLLEEGAVLEGKVTGITKFGAFVALPGGKSGMVHISEVANAYVSDIHDHLSDGQMVKVKVLAITPEGKINLSIKKAMEAPPPLAPGAMSERRPPRRDERGNGSNAPYTPRPAKPNHSSYQPREAVPARSADASFEDKLKQFMHESDSKIHGSRIYDQQRKSRRRRD